jgi:PilZ domain
MIVIVMATASLNANYMFDRRLSSRFPVQEEVKYRLLNSKVKLSGTGRTLDMSSGGILFTTEQQLSPGRTVELSVNWPAMLGNCPLKFVAVGKVVRSGPAEAAVRIQRYEFRTRASGALSRAPEEAQRLF